MNFAILSFIIGFILQFEALFLLLPWIVGMIYGEYHVALIYLVTAAVCFILGKLLSFRHTGRFKELYVREGFTAVALMVCHVCFRCYSLRSHRRDSFLY